MTSLFRFDQLRFRYQPFPIGLARPLMDDSTYRTLLGAWPSSDRFESLSKVGEKYTLSEKFGARAYRDLVSTDPVWRELHAWIKSDAFVREVFGALADHHIDLGFDLDATPSRLLLRRLSDALRGGSRTTSLRLRSRFELSMLPAKGGHVIPHTDGVQKIVTLVVSMVDEGEWDPAWGGGTDVNATRDVRLSFNRRNEQIPFDRVDVLDTFPFEPNQAVVFVKTFNSLHSVRPMTGPAGRMRRTLTINIETPT